MSRVLKSLLKISGAPASPAASAAPAQPGAAAPRFVQRPARSRALIPAALLIAVVLSAGIFLGKQETRGPASGPAAAPGLSEQELFLRNRQAVLSFYNGSLEASANELRALLLAQKTDQKNAPKSAQAALRANLGAVLLRQGKITEARTAFVQALAQNAKNPGALHGLGQVALKENELAEAEENFQLAIEAAPNRPETLLALGQVSELRSKWEDSRAYYRRFLVASADPGLKAQISARLRKIEDRSPASGPAPASVAPSAKEEE